jgi:3-isopropylmalate dehydratase small subunit
MPCFKVSGHDAEALLSTVESYPQTEVTVSVGSQSVEINGNRYQASIPAGAREALTAGTWDATGLLLDDFDRVRSVATNLPYISGF